MAQPPARVIYLPPGVTAPPAALPASAAPPMTTGLAFDRQFFEQILPQSVASFGAASNCGQPIVELLTVDGVTHYVRGISGVSDVWVALHTTLPDHDHPIQVFVPYQTIFRLAVHPCDDDERRLGFVLDDRQRRAARELMSAPTAPTAEPAAAEAPAAALQPTNAKKTARTRS